MTEKQVERDVIRELRGLGFFVSKFSQPRNSMQTEGIPDLYASHQGWQMRIWLEVKTPKGRLRNSQKWWHELERAAGGTVLVVRSAQDALEQIAELRK